MNKQEYEFLKDILKRQDTDQVKFTPKSINELSFKQLSDTQLNDMIVRIGQELRFRTIIKENA